MDSIPGDKIDGIGVSDRVVNRMAFSAVFQGPDIVTGIGLSNPDNRVAHVKASLYSEGALSAVREFQIPGYGHRGWFRCRCRKNRTRKSPGFRDEFEPDRLVRGSDVRARAGATRHQNAQ